MKIEIADATEQQLYEFATVHLGLDVPEGKGKNAVAVHMRKAGYKGSAIEIPDAPAAALQEPRQPDAIPSGKILETDLTGKIVTVLLPEQEGEMDMEFVSVNGNGMYIRRGQPSPIKYEYFRVLQDAKKIVYEQTERDGLGAPRAVSAYPIQIIDMDPEVRAFMQQQRAA